MGTYSRESILQKTQAHNCRYRRDHNWTHESANQQRSKRKREKKKDRVSFNMFQSRPQQEKLQKLIVFSNRHQLHTLRRCSINRWSRERCWLLSQRSRLLELLSLRGQTSTRSVHIQYTHARHQIGDEKQTMQSTGDDANVVVTTSCGSPMFRMRWELTMDRITGRK